MKKHTKSTALALVTGALLALLAPAAMAANIYHSATHDSASDADSWGNSMFGGSMSMSFYADRGVPDTNFSYPSYYTLQTLHRTLAQHGASIYLRSFKEKHRFGFSRSALAKVVNQGSGFQGSRSQWDNVTYFGSTYQNPGTPLGIARYRYHRITADEVKIDLFGHTIGNLWVPGSVTTVAERDGAGWDCRAEVSGAPVIFANVDVKGFAFRHYYNAIARAFGGSGWVYEPLDIDVIDQTFEKEMKTVIADIKQEVNVSRVGKFKLCDLSFPTDLEVETDGIYGHSRICHGGLDQAPAIGFTEGVVQMIRDKADLLDNGDFLAQAQAEGLRQLADRMENWIGYQVVIRVTTTAKNSDEWIYKAQKELVKTLASYAIPIPGVGWLAGKIWDAIAEAEKTILVAEFGLVKLTTPRHTVPLFSRARPRIVTYTRLPFRFR